MAMDVSSQEGWELVVSHSKWNGPGMVLALSSDQIAMLKRRSICLFKKREEKWLEAGPLYSGKK
jgi:hypothetical protein